MIRNDGLQLINEADNKKAAKHNETNREREQFASVDLEGTGRIKHASHTASHAPCPGGNKRVHANNKMSYARNLSTEAGPSSPKSLVGGGGGGVDGEGEGRKEESGKGWRMQKQQGLKWIQSCQATQVCVFCLCFSLIHGPSEPVRKFRLPGFVYSTDETMKHAANQRRYLLYRATRSLSRARRGDVGYFSVRGWSVEWAKA